MGDQNVHHSSQKEESRKLLGDSENSGEKTRIKCGGGGSGSAGPNSGERKKNNAPYRGCWEETFQRKKTDEARLFAPREKCPETRRQGRYRGVTHVQCGFDDCDSGEEM